MRLPPVPTLRFKRPVGPPFALNRESPLFNGLVNYYPLGAALGYDICTFEQYMGATAGTLPGNLSSTIGGLVTPSDGVGTDRETSASLKWIDGASQASMSCWVYRAATGQAGPMHGLWGASGNAFAAFNYLDDNYYFYFQNGNTSQFASVAAALTGWNHVLLVFDGSQSTDATKIRAYINGRAQTPSFTASPSTTLGTMSFLAVGRDNVGGVRYWQGQYADLAIWKRPLDASEAWRLFAPETRWDLYQQTPARLFFATGGAATTNATLIAAQAQVARLTKQTNAIRLATAAETALLTKQTLAMRLATESTTTTTTKQTATTRTVSEASPAIVTKQVARSMFATQAQKALETAQKVAVRALLAVQAQTAALARQVQAVRLAVEAQLAAVTKQTQVTHAAGQASASLLVRTIAKIVLVSQGAVATLNALKTLIRTILATQATTATLATLKLLTRSLLAVQATVSALQRQTAAIRIAAQTETARSARTILVTRAALQASVVSIGRFIQKGLRALQAAIAQLRTFLPSAASPRVLRVFASVNTTYALKGSVNTTYTLLASEV